MTDITKPGIYPDIPSEFYHNSGIGISKSDLDLIHRSPAHFIAAKAEPRKETPAMLLGTVAHSAILEPDLFGSRYVVSPKFDRRTKQGKEDAAAFEFEAINSGRTPIDPEIYEAALGMRDAVYAHPAKRFLAGPGQAEASLYWYDAEVLEACGCEPDYQFCKARPDWLRWDGLMLDLKTTDDASPDAFSSKLGKFRYHVQHAYYADGVEMAIGEGQRGFVFLVVEKDPPHGINVCILEQEDVEIGRAVYKADLLRYIQCHKSNHWPSYSHEVKVIRLPKWAA